MTLDYWFLDTCVIALAWVLAIVSVITLVSGLDELFIDFVYLAKILPRKRLVYSEESLGATAEQPIAVMIPAWREANVIRTMLENSIQAIRYSNYQIFVGTYPNDPETGQEVLEVCKRFPHVHRVVCPSDGPTNKADCMNAIYQGIVDWEHQQGIRFEVFVQQDAEDMVHPLSLKVFNFHQPAIDMLQLPVFALETRWRQWTGCHYADEFCEHHLKAIPVRQFLANSVPGAGVGCGFSRRALEQMHRKSTDGMLFNTHSLAEDYDFAMRMALEGLTTRFLRPVILRKETHSAGGRLEQRTFEEIVCTREYFPTKLGAAIRQKSRWILGISIQGWQQIGWKGSFWMRYMLLRDRKALMTNQINFLGYFAVAGFAALAGAERAGLDAVYPGIAIEGTMLWYTISANTLLLVWRILMRAHAVGIVYGVEQALWSVPRLVWGNLVSFFATNRAIWLWLRAKVVGVPFQWEKTTHIFPTDEKIGTFRRRIGDLLLERKYLRLDQLETALARQREDARPLGEILIDMGLVGERELFQTLGVQLQVAAVDIDPERTDLSVLKLMPREIALRHSVYPVEMTEGGYLQVAAERVPSRSDLDEIERAVGRRVDISLTRRDGLARAIERGYRRLAEES